VNARLVAVKTVFAVLYEGKSLSAALQQDQVRSLSPPDRALVQELSYGACRWYPRLQALALMLYSRPMKRKDGDVHCLTLIGLYQLIYTRVPSYAAINESVAVTKGLKKPWAKGLVNAILRRFQRESEALMAEVDKDATLQLAHPQWLYECIAASWPDHIGAILEANNTRPPMALRVNRQRHQRDDYLKKLIECGVEASASPLGVDGIVLAQPVGVSQLPGFDEGWVSVQDVAAQQAADLLDLQPGQRVLDACAAPGGKSCHILECCPELEELVAVDKDEARLERVSENLQRLGQEAALLCVDAAEVDAWWDGRPFDRILLDAPCSAIGVIRRHPDIKILRRPQDIATLVAQQRTLLERLWPLVAPGGMLLYATCSVLKEENVGQITRFVTDHADAISHPIEAEWGLVCEHGRQILPGDGGMDGFYYACLVKQQ